MVTQLDGYRHLPSNSRLAERRLGNSRLANIQVNKAAVFLDRDGVLVEDVHFLTDPKDLRLLPGVAQAIRSFQGRYYVIVATNQSAVARGMLDEAGLLEIHRELTQQLGSQGAVVDAIYYCPHLPDAPVEAYRRSCACRKPLPGMLLNANRDWGIPLDQSFMVGDNIRDVETASAAGVRGILLGPEDRSQSPTAQNARDLAGAALLISESALSSVVPSGIQKLSGEKLPEALDEPD